MASVTILPNTLSGIKAQALGVTRVWDDGIALDAGVPFETIHLGGWGVANPGDQPLPTMRDWASLDAAVARVSPDAHLILCAYDLPASFGQAGYITADWQAYGREVAEAVARYNAWGVSFWNEAKGPWTDVAPSRSQAAMQDMARATNIVHSIVAPLRKKFICGYIDLGRYSEASGRGDPFNANSAGGYDRKAWTWDINALDFVPYAYAMDYSLSQYGAQVTPEQVGQWVGRYAHIMDTFKLLSSVPIAWVEYYAQVSLEYSAHLFTPEQLGAIELASLCSQAGAVFSSKWQPGGASNSTLESWWAYTNGASTPAGIAAQKYQANFPQGTPLVMASSSSPTLTVLSSKVRSVIVNTAPLDASVVLTGKTTRTIKVPGWGAWWGGP